MPNLRGKTWTTTTPANVEDAQYWEDHLISDADAAKIGTVILPAGGTAGQVLTKQSSTANDATWEEPASSGHTIVDEDDTDMPYRTNLQFLNADVTDDSANDATVVDCKGSKGDPGDAATITVGTVTTLPAGSSATVTNSGTSSAAVFNFGIPKGADGSGAGDMLKADYDPNSVVELAGGIPDYVASQAYTLPTAASNVLGGVKVGTNLSIDANGVLSATDTNTDALHDLTDVNISLPSDGQALLYNNTSGKWENGDVAGSAADISYDNTSSGLTADDVQEAIDEIDSNLDTLDGKVYKTDDSTETTIASDDLLPIYDTSATASKKITVANVVKATVSNPNLIDNPWFTVNQRGEISYTSAGYTLDRWYKNTGITLTITDNGITDTVDSGVNNPTIFQKIENDLAAKLAGKVVTFSVMLADGTIESTTFSMPSDLTIDAQYGLKGTSFGSIFGQCVSSFSAGKFILVIAVTAGTSVNIRAVKLEVGSVSTLAMDTAPNYATELLKCQRYCIALNPSLSQYAMVATGIGWTTTEADFVLSLPTIMRTTPVFVSGNVWVLSDGVNWKTPTSIYAVSQGNNYKVIFETTGLTQGKLYLLGTDSTASPLILSADL